MGVFRMNSETIIRRPQRGRLRKAQRTLSSLQGLREEVQALKLQIARMEQVMEARQEAEAKTYHVPQSLAELKPRRQPPPGKTAMQMIQGQWPGEETTEQLLAQLKELG